QTRLALAARPCRAPSRIWSAAASSPRGDARCSCRAGCSRRLRKADCPPDAQEIDDPRNAGETTRVLASHPRTAGAGKSVSGSVVGTGQDDHSKVVDADALAPLTELDIRTSIRPTVAEIDLAAIRRNLARLRGVVGSEVAIWGVIKADA